MEFGFRSSFILVDSNYLSADGFDTATEVFLFSNFRPLDLRIGYDIKAELVEQSGLGCDFFGMELNSTSSVVQITSTAVWLSGHGVLAAVVRRLVVIMSTRSMLLRTVP
jgi:hypothetical protein